MMIVVGCICFVISFFLLLVSTTQNIKENMWEFGVLRAIGLKKGEVERVYVYESAAVTLSSIVLGFIVGLLLAIVITVQFGLFIELPFSLPFPTYLVLTMVVLSILTTYFASVIPTREINKREIAAILKSSD